MVRIILSCEVVRHFMQPVAHFLEIKNPPSVAGCGFQTLVRPKGLEPLIQAPEACVISTSPRAHEDASSITYNAWILKIAI